MRPVSVNGEVAPGGADQDRVDLGLGELPRPHQRQDVDEDMAVAVAAEGGQPRARADVVRDQHLVEMTALDQRPDQLSRELFEQQERSLLHVAATRAKKRVVITYSGKPSPFITIPNKGHLEKSVQGLP